MNNNGPNLSLGNKVLIGLAGGFLINKLVPGETQDRMFGGLALFIMFALVFIIAIPLAIGALVIGAYGVYLGAVLLIAILGCLVPLARNTYELAHDFWPISFGILPRWHDKRFWKNHPIIGFLVSPFVFLVALLIFLVGLFCVFVLDMTA